MKRISKSWLGPKQRGFPKDSQSSGLLHFDSGPGEAPEQNRCPTLWGTKVGYLCWAWASQQARRGTICAPEARAAAADCCVAGLGVRQMSTASQDQVSTASLQAGVGPCGASEYECLLRAMLQGQARVEQARPHRERCQAIHFTYKDLLDAVTEADLERMRVAKMAKEQADREAALKLAQLYPKQVRQRKRKTERPQVAT